MLPCATVRATYMPHEPHATREMDPGTGTPHVRWNHRTERTKRLSEPTAVTETRAEHGKPLLRLVVPQLLRLRKLGLAPVRELIGAEEPGGDEADRLEHREAGEEEDADALNRVGIGEEGHAGRHGVADGGVMH